MSNISQIKSRLEFRMIYDKVYTTRTKRPAMKSMILLSDDSPKELQAIVVERKKLRNNYELRVSALQDDLFLIHLQKKVWGKPVGGNLVIDCGTRGCWIAYTDESGYFVKRVLEPFFNGLYPYVANLPQLHRNSKVSWRNQGGIPRF